MTTPKIKALPLPTSRVLNVEQTAAYIGISANQLTALRKSGQFDVPRVPYCKGYDTRRVDDWLDRMGGINGLGMTDEQAWLDACDG